MSRQKLFETIINVTGFTPLESDMDEIQRAVLSEINLPNDDKIVEYCENTFPDASLECDFGFVTGAKWMRGLAQNEH